jgi:hypothetical protein
MRTSLSIPARGDDVNPSNRLQNITIAFALIGTALALRLYGVDWGLPQVYEEAQPLKKAWDMWGLGSREGFDLNPHFFNYPSLTIYLQLLGQGVLFLAFKLGGTFQTVSDFHLQYLVDKTPFYLVGRTITVYFGTLTVWVMYLFGRQFLRAPLAITAAALLAVHTFHMSKSQAIDVDVPLTFFVTLSLWLCLRILEAPTRRNYVLAGIAVGLAISTKYTGALLAFPVLMTHVLARRPTPGKDSAPWTRLLVAGGVAAAVFMATSPYVFLDASTFWEHFSIERQHMRAGHFGGGSTPAALFYVRSLAGPMLGWPIFLAALAGLVWRTLIRRDSWAIVMGTFAIVYLAAVGSWAMRADRYLLPVLPVLILFATAVFDMLFERLRAYTASRALQIGAIAAVALFLGTPLLAQFPSRIEELKLDTRRVAQEWIETNVPPGSFVATEAHGPILFGAQDVLLLSPEVRRRLMARRTDTPLYAIQHIPMFQVEPERSEVFYDIGLYEIADVVIVSNAVRSRYLQEPERFRRQLDFYRALEDRFEKVHEFAPQGLSKSSLTLYQNPRNEAPFAKRVLVPPPPELRRERPARSGSEELYYYNLGLNYEMFLHLFQAITAYEYGLTQVRIRPRVYRNLSLAKTRCLLMLQKPAEAARFLEEAAANAPSPATARDFRQLRASILSRNPEAAE